MTLLKFNLPTAAQWPSALPTFHREVNRLFEFPFGEFARQAALRNTWTPAVDLYENEDSYILSAELAGLKREDISLTLNNDTLAISGERKPTEKAEDVLLHRCERVPGKFERTVQFTKPVDSAKVSATYKDGILTVTVPKTEAAKPKQINIAIN